MQSTQCVHVGVPANAIWVTSRNPREHVHQFEMVEILNTWSWSPGPDFRKILWRIYDHNFVI